MKQKGVMSTCWMVVQGTSQNSIMKLGLVLAGIIILSSLTMTSNQANAQSEQIPSWIKNIFVFYAEGQISEADLLNAIEYLAEVGIISISGQDDKSILDKAQSEKIQDLGDFYVTYKPNPNSEYTGEDTAIYWLKDVGLLEIETAFLNENFRLPYDVEVVAQECNEVNAFYDYDVKQIIICYELIDDVFETWYLFNEDNPDVDTARVFAYDVIDYTLWHEVAHAIIDIYNLPFTGLEENVADQFASLMISYTVDEHEDYSLGQDMLYNIGNHYLYEDEYWNVIYPQQLEDLGENIDNMEIAYWDQHGLDIQRFYNISCYAYGADPEYNQGLIDDGWLPEGRAVNCEWEYHKIQDSWSYLLRDVTNGFF